MNNSYRKDARTAAGFLIAAALFSANTWATRLNVKAVLADGSAAGSGVSIQVTSGAFSATSQTGNNSRANFNNVPEGSVSVSGQRGVLQGERTVGVRGKNQNVDLTLRAPAGAAPTPPGTSSLPQPPVVSLRINNGATCTTRNSVTLNNSVSGPTPKSYRASEDSAALRTAAWQLYNAAPPFPLSTGAGTKTVYIQVQSIESGQELVSAVASDTIKRPKANATLAINNGAGTTFSRTVVLNNTASFDPDGSNPKYLASENADFSGATWQPYSSAPQFTLSAGAGTKTVYFMATKEACGAVVGTPKVSDTITLGEVTASEPVVSVATPAQTTVFEFASWDSGGSLATLPTPRAAIEYAESQGFTHRETLIGGDGTCRRAFSMDMRKPSVFFIAAPTVVRTTNVLVKSVICQYSVFNGRQLNPGWSISNVRIRKLHPHGDGKWMGSASLASSGTSGNLAIQITVPAYQCGIGIGLELCSPYGFYPKEFGSEWALGGYIDYFRLQGPSNDWHDAFKH